jgi:hypothetical protein
MDKAAEQNGESFMMFWAVPLALSQTDQCKPEARICVGVAETLKFRTVKESKKPASVAARVAIEQAYSHAVLSPLLFESSTTAVQQQWSPSQRTSATTTIVPAVHSLLLDDPQQRATLACTGCCYCDLQNRRRGKTRLRVMTLFHALFVSSTLPHTPRKE